MPVSIAPQAPGIAGRALSRAEIDAILAQARYVDGLARRIMRDLGQGIRLMLAATAVGRLEQQIDQMNAHLPPLKNFILPAGSLPVAQAHVCRAVCRRAERELVLLSHDPQAALSDAALPYLNRLSDWLFVLARSLSRALDGEEVLWQPAPSPQASVSCD